MTGSQYIRTLVYGSRYELKKNLSPNACQAGSELLTNSPAIKATMPKILSAHNSSRNWNQRSAVAELPRWLRYRRTSEMEGNAAGVFSLVDEKAAGFGCGGAVLVSGTGSVTFHRLTGKCE